MDGRFAGLEIDGPHSALDGIIGLHRDAEVKRRNKGIRIHEAGLPREIEGQLRRLPVQSPVDQGPDFEQSHGGVGRHRGRPHGQEQTLMGKDDRLIHGTTEHVDADRTVTAKQPLFPRLGRL